jgi:hypothetical protein
MKMSEFEVSPEREPTTLSESSGKVPLYLTTAGKVPEE